MNRNLKRIVSTLLSLFMITGMFVINVSAVEEIGTKGLIALNYDFETEKHLLGNSVLEKTESADIYGNSLKYIPHEANASQYSSMSVPVPKNVSEYTISFDFMLPQTDHNFKMLLRSDSTDGTSYTDFGAINWDQNGNIVASVNGKLPSGLKTGYVPDGTSGFKAIANYTANTWHNLTLRYKPNNENTTLDYYVDGKYTETSTMKEKPSTDGYLKHIFIGSALYGGISEYGSTEASDGDGTEALYIDNFVVTCDNTDYSYGSASVNGNYIRYSYTEGLENSDVLKNVSVLNTETGENMRILSANASNRSGVIRLADELDSDVEYCIVIPKEAKSATHKEIYDNIYFSSTDTSVLKSGKLLYESTSAYEYPAKNDQWKQVKFDLQGDEGQDYMVYVDMTYNAIPDNSTLKFGLRSKDDYFLITSKIADSNGRLVTYKKKGGVALDDAVVADTNNDFFHKNGLFTTGANIRVMYYIDTTNRTGSLYINDELQGTITQPYPEDKSLVPAYMLVWSQAEESSPLTINSIKVYHPKKGESKVSSFRTINLDGSQGSPYSDRTLSTARGAKIYFNCDIDESTLNSNNIVISDGSVPVEYNIEGYDVESRCVSLNFIRHLNKGKRYMVSVSNVNKTDGNAIKAYNTMFNVSNFSEFAINNREFVNSSNVIISTVPTGEVGATIGFVNSTDSDELIRRSIVLIEDGVMTAATEKTINVLKNTDNNDESNKVTVNVSDISNVQISEICSNGEYIPYGQAKVLSNVTTMTDDARKIKHTIENKELANQSVLVDIMYPDKSYADISGTDLTSVLVYRGQVILDENGKADIEFRMPSTATSNLYKLMINGVQSEGVPYSNINETKDIVAKINAAISGEEEKEVKITNIENLIKDKKYALNISIKGYDSADKNYIASLIYDYMDKNGELSVEDINKSLEEINNSVAIGCINDGKIESVLDSASELQLEKSRVSAFYKQSYATNALWQKITLELKNGNYKSKEDFYSKFYEKFVLAVIAAPDGIDNLKEVLTEFAEDIFDNDKNVVNTANEQVYRAISNKTFDSFGALKTSFINAMNNSLTPKPSGGSGGGGRLPNTNIQQGTVDNTKPEEMDIDVFSDLDGFDWAKDSIVYLAEKKIINGKGDYQFCPGDYVTRKELAKMIALAFLDKVENGKVTFTDVSDEDWAYAYIAKTYNAGIVKGYDDGSFRGDEFITRMDAAVMLYRAAENDGVDFSAEIINHFSDEDTFAAYSVDAINKLYNQKYVSGIGDNMFAPHNNLTRAEAAKIIYGLVIQ